MKYLGLVTFGLGVFAAGLITGGILCGKAAVFAAMAVIGRTTDDRKGE